MEQTRDRFDELWLRQTWFVKLRWIVPLVLVAMAFVAESTLRRDLFPRAPFLWLVAGVLLLNTIYAWILRRVAFEPSAHPRTLGLVAHAQVLFDLVAGALAAHLTGGPRSPLWPCLALTVMAAALFFMRRRAIIGFSVLAVAMSWLVCAHDQSGPMSTQPFLLAAFLLMVALICTYYAERVAESRRLAESKDEILSRVTHELRNPLSALRGFVHLAQTREKARHEERPEAQLGQTLARIDVQADRMARMVSDLYDMSASQVGELRIEPGACDLAAVVRELALRFRTVYPALTLRAQLPPALWGSWDAVRLEQLFSNLVGNAIKYAGETSTITIAVTPAGRGSAHVEVHDEGPGIPEDKLAAIFEPFQRFAARGNNKGLGLGLAIAREIVLLHGGAIWVDSQLGKGTTFHVRLPTGGVQAPS